MKNFKRLAAMTLAGAMTVGMMAGCGGSSSGRSMRITSAAVRSDGTQNTSFIHGWGGSSPKCGTTPCVCRKYAR